MCTKAAKHSFQFHTLIPQTSLHNAPHLCYRNRLELSVSAKRPD